MAGKGTAILVAFLAAVPLLVLLNLYLLRLIVALLGTSLRSKTQPRRDAIYAYYRRVTAAAAKKKGTVNGVQKLGESAIDPDKTEDWDGIVGFFHPFCNAGGGGERVLWAAIAATQQKYPKAICAVYTGDHEIERSSMVAKVKNRFDITLQPNTLHFVYLSTREFVLPSTYPHFTLLGQSLGSLLLAYDAFTMLVPDIFIDTMGYAFAVAFCKYLFPKVPTAAYVHYPTISTDMLQALDDTSGSKGIHSGAGSGWKGKAKKVYWHLFARLYGWARRRIDVVMCNSSWTSGHITELWKKKGSTKAAVVYPPCPVEELEAKIKVSRESEKLRENMLLYIAQFRPEKNHSLILRSFAKYYHSVKHEANPTLVLIGSVRSKSSDERHVYNLRLEARELKIDGVTKFICDAPFSLILEYLQRANIGVNGMYSEHFGIGNVEGLAAGLIPVVHNSGGPKLDIVVPFEGNIVGYHAETDEEYADAYGKIGKLGTEERIDMRLRGRRSAKRFTEEVFARKWITEMDVLIAMCSRRQA